MTTPTILAYDLSFSRAHFSWWRLRAAEGVRLAIQNLWTGCDAPLHAAANLQDAADAALVIAGYTVVNARPAKVAIDAAHAAAGHHWRSLAFLAVDVEVPGTPLPTIYTALGHIRQAGLRPIIYSRRSFWIPAYGDVSPGAPIWTAEYNSGPRLDTIRYPWGAGQPIIGKQYQGTTAIHGVDVDLNTFDATFVLPRKEQPVPRLARAPNGQLWICGAGVRKLVPKGNGREKDAIAVFGDPVDVSQPFLDVLTPFSATPTDADIRRIIDNRIKRTRLNVS